MVRAARYSTRVDVTLFVVCVLASLIVIVLPSERREPLAEALRRSVVAPLVGMQRGADRWRMAWLESERRMLKTDTLALQAFKVHALQRENDQLRKVIGLGRQLQWGFVPAEALQTSRDNLVTALTLTAGEQVGVQRFNPVVSADGVVGYVQSVSPSTSVAILFSHPDFRSSAMSADGLAYGVVYPRLGSDAGHYLLELRGVPLRYDIKPGTLVLTAGLGGTFPKGIPIGTVIRQVRTPEVWTRTYLVQPAVNPTNVSSVMILNAKRSAAGVEGIWKNVAGVDSAVRRIVTAGDSLNRLDAQAANAARTAAIADSLRRAGVGASGTAPDSARADSVRRAATAAQTPRRTTPAAAPTQRADSQTRRDTNAAPRARRDTGQVVGPPAPDSTRPVRPVRPPDSTRIRQ